MTYTVEMDKGGMIYKSNFIKTESGMEVILRVLPR
jgi:hypothetical protein